VQTPANGAGTIALLQRVVADRHFRYDPEAPLPETVFTSNASYVLDTIFPFATASSDVAGGALGSLADNFRQGSPVHDSPNSPLVTAIGARNYIRVDDHFETFLMYRPGHLGDDNTWVTLGVLDWSWQAEATKGANGVWTITAGSVPANPGEVIHSQDVSFLPSYTGNHTYNQELADE
jgi:hypothetical protein